MTGNPKLDLVNVDAHKKTGRILTISFQGIKQKQNSDINQGPKLSKLNVDVPAFVDCLSTILFFEPLV